MTELLEQAIERALALPVDQQNEMARVLLRLTGQLEAVYRLTPDEEADLTVADAEMARGAFATDAEVDALMSDTT